MPRHRNAGGPFLIFEPGIGITGSLGVAGKIAITSESSTPAQPPDGSGWLYTKSDGKLYWRSYDIAEVDITGGGGGDEITSLDGTTKIQVEESSSDDKIRFDTAGSESMIIDDDGNVGIGVSDPDQKLEVAGSIHISGEVSTPTQPADGDGGIMYVKTDGKLYFRSNEQSEVELTASPSNPGATLTMGTGQAENTLFAFDGNAQDFRIGINDSLDHFEIGAGLTMGTTTALRFTGTGDLVQIGSQTPSDGQVLYWDQGNSRVSWKTVAAGAAIWFLLGGSTAYDANQMSYIGFAYATVSNDYPSPWPRHDAVGTISLG
jgi:ribosomal protein L24E